MKDQELYRDKARYYDAIYSFKDYKKETDNIKKIISENKLSNGKELLDVGCGTGNHLQFLCDEFTCTGLDINQGILKVAKEKLPQVNFVHSDMSKMNLGKQFDVIISLFSSIGYITSKEVLKKTFQNFSNHLKKGGVLIIEPWLTKDIYREGSPHMDTYSDKNLKIARLNISELKGDISYFEMHYLVAEPGKKVMHFVDVHELAMFPLELLQQYSENSGMRTKILHENIYTDRGLILGIKE